MAEEKNTVEKENDAQALPKPVQPKPASQKKPAKKPRKNASANAARREAEKQRRAAGSEKKKQSSAGAAPQRKRAGADEDSLPGGAAAAAAHGASAGTAREACLVQKAAAPDAQAARPAAPEEERQEPHTQPPVPQQAAGEQQEQAFAMPQGTPAEPDGAAAPQAVPVGGQTASEDAFDELKEDEGGQDAAPSGPEQEAPREGGPFKEEQPAAPVQEEQAEKKKKRVRRRHYFAFYVAVCTGVVALASLVSIFVMFFATGNPLFSTTQDVELPNFYNMTQEEIEADEAYSNFRIEFVDVYSDEVAEGHVVDQSPRPPKEVKENARITVRVSRGVEQVEVPDMVGWTRTSASEKVKSINLSILIKYETDDTKPYNTVLRTAPAAGTVLEAGETLTVYINREELAVGSTIAPSCVGLGQNEAGRLLTSRGLSYSFIKVDSASPAGYVVSQSPRAGESMAQGGSVTLRVSNGQGASGDGTIRDPNVADGSVTGHHHTWVAWQDGKWICTVCNAVK